MDRVYEELDEAKAEIDKIKEECRAKESIIKHLSFANEKLRADCDEKLKKWEGENRELVMALDEANEKSRDHELKMCSFMGEIEGLKGLLSVSQKKCLEAEKKATASKELREGNDMLLKLEEKNREVEVELKWKKEQFKHLEEAHEKLQDQFRASKKEWEIEKSTLIDEICSLQTRLDSQTRVSQDLQSRLERCNQALAHEESRRKYLEVELSESKISFENASAECQEAKSKIECLTHQRDEEIGALRNSLGTKETLFKEVEYQTWKLEQENQELRVSLKELQEAQINQSGSSSSSSSMVKLRNKLKRMDQINRDSSANLKAKELEWSSTLKKMEVDMNTCRSELNSKDAAIRELKMQLESSKLIQSDYCSANLGAIEAQWSSQLEKMTKDLNECKYELEIKDKFIKELKMELESSKLIQSDYCSANLGAIEAKWSSQLEKMTEDLNKCKYELEIKDKFIKELKMELEGCHSSIIQLQVQTEETSLMLSVYKTGFTEAQSMIENEKAEIDQLIKERDENFSLFMKQLEMKNTALAKAQTDIEEERQKAESLLRRFESFDLTEQQQQQQQQLLLIQKELERYKEMLMESSEYQQRLKEQALQMDSYFKERLREACDALEKANYELTDKAYEGSEIGFEMEMWKSIAERLKSDLVESHELRRELEASLLSQVEVEEILKQEKLSLTCTLEERDRRIDNLQQQIVSLKTSERETASFERMETQIAFESEKEKILEDLQKKIERLEQDSIKQEKLSLTCTLEERDRRIDNLQQQIVSLKTSERETASFERMETQMAFESEKEKILEDLQREIERLEQDSMRKELEGAIFSQIGAERTIEHEKQNLMHIVNERDQRIDDLLQHLKSLEHKFNTSLTSFSSQLEEKEAQINLVQEAWEKITTADVLAKLEIEEKKLMILELEDDIANIQQKLELQEISSSQSQQQALEIESKLEAKLLEFLKLSSQMETKLRNSDALINDLKSEKRTLREDIVTLSSEREKLLGEFGEFCDRIGEFSGENMQLMGMLGNIVQTFNNDVRLNSLKENQNALLSPTTKKFEAAIAGERSPFKELNN